MDQFYYDSGYIQDGYYTYVAEAAIDIASESVVIASPRTIKQYSTSLDTVSTMIVTPGAISRLTIVPVAYTSTAGRLQYGSFYIDAGPTV